MKRTSSPNAREALDQMKTEIANELDASFTNEERSDGAMARDLVIRAEKKLSDRDTFNRS